MRKIFLLCSVFLLLAAAASADTIGNEVIDRYYLDGATNIAFIDPTLEFTTAGTLTSWSIWFKGYDPTTDPAPELALQIYRPTASDTDWQLVHNDSIAFTTAASAGVYNLPSTGFGDIQAGDVIGWWFGDTGGLIPYDNIGTDDVEWTHWTGSSSTPIYTPEIGTVYSFDTSSWANSSQHREYSIAANYSPVPEPATILLLGFGMVGLAGLRKKFWS